MGWEKGVKVCGGFTLGRGKYALDHRCLVHLSLGIIYERKQRHVSKSINSESLTIRPTKRMPAFSPSLAAPKDLHHSSDGLAFPSSVLFSTHWPASPSWVRQAR
jgi:hypothetical protein